MIQTKITHISRRVIYSLAAVLLVLAYYPTIVSAAAISERSVQIGSSVADATTTYNFTFTLPTSTAVKSVTFTPCQTASGTCDAVAGFDASTSSLSQQPTNLGSGTWTSAGTATALRITNSGNSTAQTTSPVTVNFSSVHNPSVANATFYVRIATFSADNYTGAIDSGVVATSTAGQITVSAVVDETLNFTLTSSSVDLGTLTKTSTGSGTSSMTIGTNAESGYTLSYSGATLTSGVNTITAMAAAAGSVQNSKQFGINLMANATPSVGSNVTGTGTGTPATGYGTANQFKFNTAGEVIASAVAATNDNTFTTSYIANIDSSTAAGVYNTILTYVVTANF